MSLRPLSIDPKRFRLAELIAMGEWVRHNLALRAVGTLTSSRLTLGRCLLAIQETGDFKKHGCSCSTHYAVAKLGMEKREANEFKRVARALTLLPELSLAAEEGLIAWGKLREIVRVAAEETEQYWLQLAGRYNDKQIQALVSKTPRGAVPGEVDLEETAYRSYFQCPFDPETSVLYDAAKRAFSLKENKAMTHAEFMKELLTSYQAGRTLDEEAKAKILKEADKDLQAERARLIPVVAEARETALEMGLIEADDDILEFADLDPHRVESEYFAKFLAEALGADSFDEKLMARINADRVQADRNIKGKDAAALAVLYREAPNQARQTGSDEPLPIDSAQLENFLSNVDERRLDSAYAYYFSKIEKTSGRRYTQGLAPSCGFVSAAYALERRQPGALQSMVQENGGMLEVTFPGAKHIVTMKPLTPTEQALHTEELESLGKAWGIHESGQELGTKAQANQPERPIKALTGNESVTRTLPIPGRGF